MLDALFYIFIFWIYTEVHYRSKYFLFRDTFKNNNKEC